MTVTIELDPETQERLLKIANRNCIDVASLIETMVKAQLSLSQPEADAGDYDGRTLGELFSHLFGTATSARRDVAQHPEKYMVGFGKTIHPRPLNT